MIAGFLSKYETLSFCVSENIKICFIPVSPLRQIVLEIIFVYLLSQSISCNNTYRHTMSQPFTCVSKHTHSQWLVIGNKSTGWTCWAA